MFDFRLGEQVFQRQHLFQYLQTNEKAGRRHWTYCNKSHLCSGGWQLKMRQIWKKITCMQLKSTIIHRHTSPGYILEYQAQKCFFWKKTFALLKISLFAANKATIVEVEGPVDGGEDVGLGQDVHQHQHDQQRRRQVSQGQRHRADCNHRLLRVLIPQVSGQINNFWVDKHQFNLPWLTAQCPSPFSILLLLQILISHVRVTKFLLLSVPNQINLWLNAK